MNKGLLGFLIAGSLAIIAFLIYYFFFRKSGSQGDNSGMLGGTIGGSVANNPIVPQDTTNKLPDYVPVNPDIFNQGEFGNQTGTGTISAPDSIFVGGFSDTPQETLSKDGSALSQRANNPGALFWDGTTNWQGMDKDKTKKGQIIYFTSVDYGVRAQLMTLKNYDKKHGITTLIGITTRYAPVGHGSNDPTAYAKTLAGCLGMNTFDGFHMDVNRNLLAAIGYFMHRVEAGYYWVPRSKYLEWCTKV